MAPSFFRRRPVRRSEGRLPYWRESLPFCDYALALDSEHRQRLHDLTAQLLRSKHFEGGGGFRIDDRVRTAIAVQACLPILELGLDYTANWRTVIIYPGDFLVQHAYMDEAGVLHEMEEELSGESWPEGPVILSWEGVTQREAGAPNVVIHEFAHQLDMLNGEANGFPPLHPGMDPRQWTDCLQGSFDVLVRQLDSGQPVRVDEYAADGPAEFFAVMSEHFFMDPPLLREDFPELYGQLSLFYRQDPWKTLAG